MSGKKGWLAEFLSDDNRVEFIYRQVRNVAVCSTVAVAGVYLVRSHQPIFGWILVIASCILVMINILHIVQKSKDRAGGLAAKIVMIVPCTLYAIGVYSLFAAGIAWAFR